MPKTESLAVVLDRCLARLQSGTATVEDCLRDHPELAVQLAPLLQTAQRAGHLLAASGPTAEYRKQSQARLLNQLRAASRAERGRSTGRAPGRRLPVSLRGWKPAYALAGLALALALIGSGVAVAGAAAESLPGDGLYGLKRGLEEITLILSTSAAGDAELLLGFAGRRVAEAQALIEAGREEDLSTALTGYQRELSRLLAQRGQDDRTLDRLAAAIRAHQSGLTSALERAAPRARPAIEKALQHNRQGQEEIDQARQGRGPDQTPPDQLRRTPGPDQPAQGRGPTGEQAHPNRSRTPGPPPWVSPGPPNQEADG
jgi:hypothetical protein